jgi:(R)-2-hydroxyacyl-CoA dehydratese activating ATPase
VRDALAQLVAGVDIGSVTAEAVVLQAGRVVGASTVPTGASSRRAGERALDEALQQAGAIRESLAYVVATGYGRAAIPFANRQVTEITCHARGAHHLEPSARTVIDIGGQDSKVIRLDATGASVDFVMNDKCAAGTGRFLEVMARALEVDITELGKLSARARQPAPISSMCTVFAESEMVALVADSVPVEEIVAGLHAAIAERVMAMAHRLGVEPAVMMTGGVALNGGVVSALQDRLGCDVIVPPDPQRVGALGAALLAGRYAG